MSETNPAQPVEEDAAAAPEAAQQEPKTFDADYVDKLRKESAKYRTEAKANAEAAKRLAQIEESNKSDAEKAAERLAAAERVAANAEAKVLRRELAIEYRLDKDDAALLDAITDEDAMRSLAERLKPSDEPTGPRAPRPDANQGRSGAAGPKSTADSFAEFFRNNLSER